jgi:hypothetical protein
LLTLCSIMFDKKPHLEALMVLRYSFTLIYSSSVILIVLLGIAPVLGRPAPGRRPPQVVFLVFMFRTPLIDYCRLTDRRRCSWLRFNDSL